MPATIPAKVCLAVRDRRPWTVAAALLLTLFLGACVTTGRQIEAPPPAAGKDAAAFFARGDYAQAAAAWQDEAEEAPPGRAGALRVSAADAWLLAGNETGAERALRGVAKTDLAPADQARLNLVLADLALRSGRADEADVLLRQAADELPTSSLDRYRSLRARASQLQAGPVSGEVGKARQLSQQMLAYNPALAVELMRTLETVSSAELSIRADNPRADRQWAGWLDLARTIRENLVIADGVVPAVAAWKLRYPDHLLTESEALDTWLRYRQQFVPPRRTAVLLPEIPRLRSASDAIRDGLLSAYLADPGGGELRFYSTGDDPQSAIAAYFSALDAGADMIIGPLRKEAVAALLQLPGLTTPVLALNDLPDGFVPPPGLTGQLSGISLSQEAEVAAIADHAVASEYRRAIVVAPESAWGDRMAAVFEAGFLQPDRQIIAATRYLESENDHSAVLERILRIDESKARAQQLERVLQIPLEFEPVRRTDVDVIFLAANPEQAKQIRPQLRFLDAGDIPVYATGRIYSGQPDPSRNLDLDGIRFPTTPWELNHAAAEDIPDLASLKGGTLGSLFALGQDAWNALRWLPLLRRNHDFSFSGLSGSYRMNPSGRLERQPAWAQFSGGRPTALATPPALPRQVFVRPVQFTRLPASPTDPGSH